MFKYTKPRGDQASFVTDCHRCNGELTISNGRPDNHTCEPRQPITLADLRAALDNRQARKHGPFSYPIGGRSPRRPPPGKEPRMSTGDVYTYTPDQRHCREGLAIENERGRLIDWFWGGHDLALDNIVDRDAADLTPIANLNDYELTPRDGRESNREYAREDRLTIHSQHGLQRTYYIRKGATPDLATKIANARERLEEAESELSSAKFSVKWARKELAELELANANR